MSFWNKSRAGRSFCPSGSLAAENASSAVITSSSSKRHSRLYPGQKINYLNHSFYLNHILKNFKDHDTLLLSLSNLHWEIDDFIW